MTCRAVIIVHESGKLSIEQRKLTSIGYRLIDPIHLPRLFEIRRLPLRCPRIDRVSFTSLETKDWIRSGGNCVFTVSAGQIAETLKRMPLTQGHRHTIRLLPLCPVSLPIRWLSAASRSGILQTPVSESKLLKLILT